MNCPACGKTMSEITIGKLVVDACRDGCGGLWFDKGEIRGVDEAGEAADPLLGIEPVAGAADQTQRRLCPRDPGIVMMRRFWSVKQAVTIDECPACAGVFLDAGELARIRSEFTSEADRRKAQQAFYDSLVVELEKQADQA